MIVGYDFWGDEEFYDARNNVSDFSQLTFTNMMIDEFHLRRNTSVETSCEKVPWAGDTIMLGRFQNDLEAGSIGMNGLEITHVLLKKRRIGDMKWLTVAIIPFDKTQIIYSAFDRFTEALETYEYAIVPVAGDLEGNYSIGQIDVDFQGCYIFDRDKRYKLFYNFELGDISSVMPNAKIETLGGRYPIVVYNGDVDYQTGSVKCFLIASEDGNIDMRAEKALRNAVYGFLRNKKPKVLKNADGLYILINILDNPTLKPHANVPGLYELSFSYVEIGDLYDEETLRLHDLYEDVVS